MPRKPKTLDEAVTATRRPAIAEAATYRDSWPPSIEPQLLPTGKTAPASKAAVDAAHRLSDEARVEGVVDVAFRKRKRAPWESVTLTTCTIVLGYAAIFGMAYLLGAKQVNTASDGVTVTLLAVGATIVLLLAAWYVWQRTGGERWHG